MEINEGRPESDIDIFDKLYQEEEVLDELRYHERGAYSGFRVLKSVLMSPFFGAVSLNGSEIRGLVDKLISSNKTASDFREWIRISESEWERDLLPKTVRRIYAMGKKALEGRKRAK